MIRKFFREGIIAIQFLKILPIFLGSLFVISACQSSETPAPTIEITPSPTSTSTPTPTIEWFPATSTPTLIPTIQATPTQDYRPNLGEVILRDDFSNPGSWTLGKTSSGNVALGLNELTIAIAEPKAYDYSVRQDPVFHNFYMEITASPMLCQGEDQYGILIRMTSPGDFYRYSITCDGQVRLDRVVQGAASSPQPWMMTGSVPPGAPITVRLGVWASDDEFRFFVNDQFQFGVKDPLLQSGNIGLFARSMGETAVTVNFSDLIIRQIEQ